jgi:hypothetical protein
MLSHWIKVTAGYVLQSWNIELWTGFRHWHKTCYQQCNPVSDLVAIIAPVPMIFNRWCRGPDLEDETFTQEWQPSVHYMKNIICYCHLPDSILIFAFRSAGHLMKSLATSIHSIKHHVCSNQLSTLASSFLKVLFKLYPPLYTSVFEVLSSLLSFLTKYISHLS